MKQDDHATTTSSGAAPISGRSLGVGRTLFDTTWRIATPVLLFCGLGIFLDLRFGSKPWLTLLGVVIGFVLGTVLIMRLLKQSEDQS